MTEKKRNYEMRLHEKRQNEQTMTEEKRLDKVRQYQLKLDDSNEKR